MVVVNDVVVFDIVVPAVAKLSNDDSQRTTLPVLLLNVRVVLFVPVHTVALPATVPPTDVELMEIVAATLFALVQGLL